MDKIVLFDMDGTLIDSTNAIYESFCAVFKAHSLPILRKDEVAKFIGYTLQDMFAFFGVPQSHIEQYCEEYKKYYRAISKEQTTLLPNALQSIKLASQFAYLGIVTTKTSAATKDLLEYFGVAQYFMTIIGREDVRHTKPHKEPILNALDNIKSKILALPNNKNIFMIGDTILDLQSAQNAKVCGIGILCGYGRREDMEQISPYIFEDSLQAVRFIQTL